MQIIWNMENIKSFSVKFVLLAIIGFQIGYISVLLTSHNSHAYFPDINYETVQNTNKSKVEDVRKIRILCYLHTRPSSHANRAIHIRKTWGKHCTKVLFASTATNLNLGAYAFNVTDSYATLWAKTKNMMQHIYNEYIDDYDWFFKGDDDTFLIPDNLRYLLSAYSTNDPIYFGHKFKSSDHMRGFFSGGSGYAMSQKTVRIFVENVLTNEDFMSDSSKCHIKEDEGNEDWFLAECLDKYNVYAVDARDLVKRERFIPLNPEQILFLKKSETSHWYWRLRYYSGKEGADCCSNHAISFHYVKPKYQYTMYYLTHGLKTYGVVNELPSPPQKRNVSEIASALDLESFKRILRGL